MAIGCMGSRDGNKERISMTSTLDIGRMKNQMDLAKWNIPLVRSFMAIGRMGDVKVRGN